ncbi:hypothetical protein F558DRAFT_04974 [Streptomyces sp. AmelKG-A3]|nr:hypothetical protein GA0115247_10055 [Streptomyces sp. PalvLS-984]SDD84096.1 hypothetical protein F558DRAFT_04974 [Streptomyces sp. AmelKG-A3]
MPFAGRAPERAQRPGRAGPPRGDGCRAGGPGLGGIRGPPAAHTAAEPGRLGGAGTARANRAGRDAVPFRPRATSAGRAGRHPVPVRPSPEAVATASTAAFATDSTRAMPSSHVAWPRDTTATR